MCRGSVVGSLNKNLGETSNDTGDDNTYAYVIFGRIRFFSDAVQFDPMSGPDLCDAAKYADGTTRSFLD